MTPRPRGSRPCRARMARRRRTPGRRRWAPLGGRTPWGGALGGLVVARLCARSPPPRPLACAGCATGGRGGARPTRRRRPSRGGASCSRPVPAPPSSRWRALSARQSHGPAACAPRASPTRAGRPTAARPMRAPASKGAPHPRRPARGCRTGGLAPTGAATSGPRRWSGRSIVGGGTWPCRARLGKRCGLGMGSQAHALRGARARGRAACSPW